MADNTDKKMTISIEVLDNFITAKKNLDLWNKALKDAEATQSTTAKQYQEIAKKLGVASIQYAEANKALEGAAKSEELFNAATEKTIKSLGEMQRELALLESTPLDNLSPEQISLVQQKMSELTVSIQSYKEKIEGLDPGQVFTNMGDGLQVVSALASTLGNTLNALGVESESVENLQKGTEDLISTMQTLSIVSEYIEKQKYKLVIANIASIGATIKETITRNLNAAAIALESNAESTSIVLKAKNAIATKLVTGATWLWNAALKANPVLLIVSGVAALVGGIIALVSWMDKNAEASIKAANAQNAYETQCRKTGIEVAKITNEEVKATNARIEEGRKEINELKSNGASKEAISAAQAKMEKDLRAIQREAADKRLDEHHKEYFAQQKALNAEMEKANAMMSSGQAGSKAYKELVIKIDDATKSLLDFNTELYHQQGAIDNLNQSDADADQKSKEEKIAAAKEAETKAYDYAVKRADGIKKLNEQSLKAELGYLSQDLLVKQEYERKLYDLNEKGQLDRLALDLRYGKISKKAPKENELSDYDIELEAIAKARKEFDNQQIKAINDYNNGQVKELIGMIDDNTQQRIQDVKDKYSKAIGDLSQIKPPQLIDQGVEQFEKQQRDYEKLMLESAEIKKQLEAQTQKEIADIEKAATSQKIADIETKYSDKYESDLAKFTDNEREKTKVQIQQLTEQIEAKKKAGLEVGEDEANLRTLQSQAVQLDLNTELLKAGENAGAKYKLKKAALEEELKIYEGNADKQMEINNQLAENEKELFESRIEAFEEWSGQTMELMSAVNELVSVNEDAELQRYQEDNEAKKASLQQRLDAGLISQEEFDAGVAAADNELSLKQAEIARKQAIREKALRVFDIGMNTATAIMKNTAQLGLLAAIPVNIATGILGAVQLAAVLAQPLPKASRGMLLNGPSHALGGIPIEAEGGEAIINKRSTAMFKPLLSAINAAGGGVPFAGPMTDGGYALRSTKDAGGNAVTREEFLQAMKAFKVYLTVEDYRKADGNYTEVENRSTGY